MDIVGLVVLGLAAGTLGSLLGLGGGFLVVPALVLLRGYGMVVATATSIGVIVPAMIVALTMRREQVDWRVALLVGAGAVGGALVGSHLSKQIDPTLLRRLFAVVLVVLAALLAFKKPA